MVLSRLRRLRVPWAALVLVLGVPFYGMRTAAMEQQARFVAADADGPACIGCTCCGERETPSRATQHPPCAMICTGLIAAVPATVVAVVATVVVPSIAHPGRGVGFSTPPDPAPPRPLRRA